MFAFFSVHTFIAVSDVLRILYFTEFFFVTDGFMTDVSDQHDLNVEL